MTSVADHKIVKGAKPSIPKPSSSVVLISPTNQVLLLHRVRTSTSFPSAHVFPGGNVSAAHDGLVPQPDSPGRHVDGPAYRNAAIRETFEESGIILAHDAKTGRLLEVSEQDREAGRKAVHKGDVTFPEWLSKRGGKADVEGLIPFTRWITPTGVPKRFTTQMYLYFLPTNASVSSVVSGSKETMIPVPTHDGGVEHTAAQFLPAEKWIEMAQAGEVILFPPQFFLLSMVSQFCTPKSQQPLDAEALEQQRTLLRDFAKGGNPLWADVCISPQALIGKVPDGRTVMTLEKPGEGLEKQGRQGTREYVIMVHFAKEGPRRMELKTRAEIVRDIKDSVKETGTAYSHHLQHLQTGKGKL